MRFQQVRLQLKTQDYTTSKISKFLKEKGSKISINSINRILFQRVYFLQQEQRRTLSDEISKIYPAEVEQDMVDQLYDKPKLSLRQAEISEQATQNVSHKAISIFQQIMGCKHSNFKRKQLPLNSRSKINLNLTQQNGLTVQ
ncbi:hypothetical protein ABPG72_009313 [Tetrahymena utriculariae]